jgi:hypothetical protein
MAAPISTTFTMPDRRKKVVTYGRSARFTAAPNLQNDAPSPERPRKHANITHGTVERGAASKVGDTLNSTRTGRLKDPTSDSIFDVPSDNESTPRPSTALKKKAPPAKAVVDEFDFPGSEDERPRTSRKVGKIAQPLRRTGPVDPSVYVSKKSVQTQGQTAISSSDEAQAAVVPPARRRAKTPQAIPKPTSAILPQPTVRTSVKPSTRSRATTPAAPVIAATKNKSTARVPARKVAAKPPVPNPSALDVFDVPSTDEDAPAKTPIRPRAVPVLRTKPASTAPVLHAPPSPAPSIESDVSTASHKRKRRASASSSATTKPTQRPERTCEPLVLQRNRKYQKKEDSISPGHEAKKVSQPLPQIPTKGGGHANQKPRRTRLPTDPGAVKPKIVKGQSSPATLHTMLAVRSLAMPASVLERPEAAFVEDETMYDIPEVATPLARTAKASIPGSVTPRQQALFSNLLGDSSDSTTSMPSISRLRLTEQRPRFAVAALSRSSSDVPQSTHTRKGRLIDMLKQAAPSSDEDSESDEETEEDIADIPASSTPIEPTIDTKSASQATSDKADVDLEAASNSQASQAAVHLHSGARITYAKQRSMLEENNFEDELMLAMDIDDDMGLQVTNRQGSVSEDGDDATQARGIHELRRQGQQYRFHSEASASIEDISERGGLNPSQRRSAVIEIATRMADKSYVGQLLESSLTASLLRSLAPSGEIIFDFAAAVAILFILQSRPGYAVLDQVYQSSALETLNKLMTSNFVTLDIHRIAKDRKTNMSLSARETVAEFRTVILDSVWPDEKPEKVTPQLVAMKVLERLVLGLRKAGSTETMVGEDVITRLLDAALPCSQHMKASKATTQDHLTIATTFSILEALSVSHDKQATWSNDILGRLANMMPILFEASSDSPTRLVIRLCMNLTNNKPQACQQFAWPAFVLPLLRSISHNFKSLASEHGEERRNEVMEDLILSLGAMINLAEYSDQARASVVRDGDGLIGELVAIFLEGSARAEQVCIYPCIQGTTC